MSLQSKILHLKLEAALAVRHANGWQRLIDLYGEARATEFYKYLGLNHLDDDEPRELHIHLHTEKKSITWDGLTLSREPKEHEKLAVKGIAQAQESGKEVIGKTLRVMRVELIVVGIAAIGKLKPANYHELVLHASDATIEDLRDYLIQVHLQGRMLVARELGADTPKGFVHNEHCHKRFPFNLNETVSCQCLETKQDDDDFDELDDLTDLTTSRIANDVQSRITAAASRFTLLGQSGPTLINSVTNEVTGGSVAYIDRAATGLANKVINLGREDEAENRRDEWGRVEYSALLDQNVCGPCASEDGQSSTNEDDLQPTPNPECEGGDWCRCFHVYVQS